MGREEEEEEEEEKEEGKPWEVLLWLAGGGALHVALAAKRDETSVGRDKWR